ncbi:hypothetical protein [uncultured Campylobacter sp.]|uniref:hypothetical protein n=1 Tax=uncultured Campylobacter sp. TaxID=218934 RepID=UPI0026359F44|nr:hypothetical protein [uncultured Campylobacter sp.]
MRNLTAWDCVFAVMPCMSYAYASPVLAIIYGAVNLIVARDLSRLDCDTPRLNFGCITAVP